MYSNSILTHDLYFIASVFDGSQTTSTISMQTAIAVILAVVVAFCASKIASMQGRINALEEKQRPEASADQSTGLGEESSSVTVPREIVAAISAAVISSLGRNTRIVKVSPTSHESQAWSVEGRRNIFHSHSVR